jgi:hypothetical protein
MLGVCDAFEESVGGVENGDCDFGAIEIGREAGVMTFAGFAEEYSADGTSGPKSFFDESRAFNAYGAGFCGEAAAEGHAEFLEPLVVARGD